MRIISKDGLVDLPYEHFAILVAGGTKIIAQNENTPDRNHQFLLACYSTGQEAEDAMTKMQEAYEEGRRSFRFPKTKA